MRHAALFVLSLVLAACGPRGGFPSLAPRPGELPRLIEAPGGDSVPALAPEEQAGLRADLARERARLGETRAALRASGAALDRALAGARGQGQGTDAWSQAQMALSRHDAARSPLGEIAARLAPLQRKVDSLPADDADRRAVEWLAAETLAAADAARQQIDAAGRQLGN